MRKRDELANPTSCLNKAADHEWLFVLLGRDPAAAETVENWIRLRIELGRNRAGDPKIKEAEAWVEAVSKEAGRAPKWMTPPLTLRQVEEAYILNVLAACKHNKRLAAETLGLSLRTLYNRLRTIRAAAAPR